MERPQISIIITFFNNEPSINELFERLDQVSLNPVFESKRIQLILVDDGSKDNSFSSLETKIKNVRTFDIQLIKLTRNFGSYQSFLAGMHYAEGECIVYLHSDLQDPPELIPEMYGYYQKGIKLIIANREDRADSNFYSSIYHWMVSRFAIRKIPPGGFDLILFDHTIKDEVLKISEKDTNQVYLITWLGYPYTNIPYKREKRKHGKSQWKFGKKVQLFIDTIYSFTTIPIFAIRFSLLLTFLISIAIVGLQLAGQIKPSESMSILLPLGIMLCMVNVWLLSEYIFRIHKHSINRPPFVVEKKLNN